MLSRTLIAESIMIAASLPTHGEIISSGSDHYVLEHKATSSLPVEDLWKRLVDPAIWWHPEHTYSGSSENLTLELEAGGLWREDWQDGAVVHGTLMNIEPGKTLSLDAPFGPLQDMAVSVIWTITLNETDLGTEVTFKEIANGSSVSTLDEIAPAVDFVKAEAMARLVMVEED